jgi:hypothetical protein
MSLFEFDLLPVEVIPPWGEEPNKEFNWFILGFASFTLNVRGRKLFRLSDEIISYWKQKHQEYWASKYSPYVTDHIEYFYRDILSILPNILQSIPDSIFQYVNTTERQLAFSRRLRKVYEENDSVDEEYFDAMEWLWRRKIDTSVFRCPDVHFFRFQNKIIIRWFSQHAQKEGIPIFFEADGEDEYTTSEFLVELESFHQRYIEEMKRRLDFVVEQKPVPNMSLDVSANYKVYEERKSSLKEAIEKPPLVTDWSVVLAAINKIESVIQKS